MADIKTGELETRGYELSIADRAVNEKFLCVICRLILRKPMQGCCGHRFCEECCLQRVKNGDADSKYCPACLEEEEREELSGENLLDEQRTYPDNATKRELARVAVHCINSNCAWKGCLGQYDSHVKECRMAPFDCKYCGKKDILRLYKELHYNEECGVRMRRRGSQMMDEDEVYQIMKIKRRTGRLTRPIQESKTRQNQVTSQLRGIAEVDPALGTATALVGPSRSDILKEMREINSLRGTVTVNNNINSIRNQDIMGILKRVKQANKAKDEKIAELSIQLQNHEIDKDRLRQVEQASKEKNAKIAELSLQLRIQEMTSYDGTLVWKIPEVTRRRSEALTGSIESIYSQPFYTSRAGYKMCTRLYFNGDRMGFGTHISIHFAVMKGEYDNILRWPFQQKVQLMLLDLNHKEHINNTFQPNPTSTPLLQPQTNMNIAPSFPMFCPLSRIDNPGNACYVKEDTMYVKIIVDVTNL